MAHNAAMAYACAAPAPRRPKREVGPHAAPLSTERNAVISERTITRIIDALNAGQTPHVAAADIPCFSDEALKDSPVVQARMLDDVLASLSKDDIPTLERALVSLRLNDQAWLGFKLVTDAAACLTPVDPNAPADSKQGPSADATSTVFFANEGKDIVCSRPWNRRDRFQMLDVTRGPSMHTDQFPGVTWTSVPLFTTQRVVIYGAGEVSVYIARYAADCGFDSIVVDDDAAFLTPQRFPISERLLLEPGWGDMEKRLVITPDDYCVCVSRSHAYDDVTLAYSVKSPAFYVGMMGNPGKNQDVYNRIIANGITPEQLERVSAPIGVKIADKTPAEIAISIIAELIDVRGKERQRTAARVREQLAA